jgi:cell division protein FtsZ
MTIKLSMPDVEAELKPRITVIGVGGAGGNAVNNMIESNLAGVEFLVCNTDAQALGLSQAERRIQLGVTITQGLGAGARPEVGRAAAEEALEEVLDHLTGCHMVFITAGMGGGTGTGAAPVIARAAREQGILTVGVVTKPFHFEGMQRMRLAESGIEELTQYVDTLIIIPNQNLFRVANEKTTFADAFNMADNVLYSGVRGVTDLMVMPGLINLDFADVRTVMSEMGKAMMGTGESENERRAIEAAEAAISNPLLDDITMEGARGVLINITGGPDMTLFEVDEAANRIREEVDPDANILFGSTFDENMEGRLRVSVVATGIDAIESRVAPRLTGPAAAAAVQETAPVAATEEITEPAQAETVEFETVTPEQTDTISQPEDTSPQSDQSFDSPIISDRSPSAFQEEPVAPVVEQPSVEAEVPNRAPLQSGTAPTETRNPFIPRQPVTPAMISGEESPATSGNHVSDLYDAGSAGGEPVRRRSLFERMTGVARTREPESVQPTAPRLDIETAREPEIRISEPKPQPAPQPLRAETPPKPENPPAQASPAPEAAAAAPKEEPKSSEEEVLDIPAFLRRQAN